MDYVKSQCELKYHVSSILVRPCQRLRHQIICAMYSGVARPGPTRACALPSTSQALPSPTQLESRDSMANQTKVKKYIFILLHVLTA